MNAKISIIVPIYKVQDYLARCIDSLINQTIDDIEIILVDDGSPDDSGKIADDYAARDPRVRVIHQKNMGLSAARNAGMDACRAPWIMFVDSDDYVRTEYAEKLLAAVQGGADVAVCGTNIIYESGANMSDADARYFRIPPRNIDSVNVCATNKIFNMEIIRKNDVRFPMGLNHEDEYFWNAYVPWCRNFAWVPKKLYDYCKRADGITGTESSQGREVKPTLLRIAAALGDYYTAHDLMKTHGDRFWRFFDTMVHAAAPGRPARKKKRRGFIRRLLCAIGIGGGR